MAFIDDMGFWNMSHETIIATATCTILMRFAENDNHLVETDTGWSTFMRLADKESQLMKNSTVHAYLHIASHVEGDSSGRMNDIKDGEVETEGEESGAENDENWHEQCLLSSGPSDHAHSFQKESRQG